MKIAIHNRKGSFSEKWVEYCRENNINFKLVNAYDNDIIEQVKDCDIFMWHHHQGLYTDLNFAKQLLFALQQAGKVVFPNFNTGWHFDDKLGQKYLFEALGAPFAKSYAFYSKDKALEWAKNTTYPKIFKLRGGAGSSNVRMIKSFSECKKYINKAFSKGFKTTDRWSAFKDRIKSYKNGNESFLQLVKGFVRLFLKTHNEKMQPIHKGYVYFQEFIENEGFDIRIIIIGDRAFAIKRLTRKDDFRASGSGRILYDKSLFDTTLIKETFKINEKIRSQSFAVDYVYNPVLKKYYLIEVSCGFVDEVYNPCQGCWDQTGTWYDEKYNGTDWVIEEVIQQFKNNKNL